MPGFLALIFNPYDRVARLQPALLAALPILVSIVLLTPAFGSIWAAIGGLLLYCGATTAVIQIGRDRGRRLELDLFESWGGKPSAAMLRHSDTRLPATTKERYRKFLTSSIPGLKLASEEDEQRCPEWAEDGYESATAWLLAQTRDRKRFELLFRENVNYGFRRNIWAFKRWAFVAGCITIAAIAALHSNTWTGELTSTAQSVGLGVWASFVLTLTHMLFFGFMVQKKWLRLAAEAYAKELLAACDKLGSERKN